MALEENNPNGELITDAVTIQIVLASGETCLSTLVYRILLRKLPRAMASY